MPDIVQKIRDTVRRHNMLCTGDSVLAAVSGGADSIVMLHVLLRLKEEHSLKITVAHLDHGLRGAESRRDYRFVESLSRELGVGFEGGRLKKGELKGAGSTQEAAREKRYSFLKEAAARSGSTKVALGHTLDDQAETVLMRLLKGASLSGLTGVPPVREAFIRPLIEVGRHEIDGYAQEHGLKYVVDSSNLTLKYLRNRVRLELLPFLKKGYNPNIIETLARTASVLSVDDEFIEKEAQGSFEKAVADIGADAVVFDRRALLKLHDALASRVFLMGLHRLVPACGVSNAHVRSFIELVMGADPSASVSLPDGYLLRREYDRVIMERQGLGVTLSFDEPLNIPGATSLALGKIKAAISRKPASFKGQDAFTAFFDYDLIKRAGELRARQTRPGDRLVPLGMKGHRKLKDIFIDSKVPRPERKATPIITAGGAVIWAVGVRQSEEFKVRGATSRVLRLTFVKGGQG